MRINNINNYHIFNNSYKPNQNNQTRFVTFSAKDTFKNNQKNYINPVTKEYDKKIKKMELDLYKRNGGKCYDLAIAGIDASTGEYSPYFKKLMGYCYPKDIDKIFSKFREDLGKKIYNRNDNDRRVPDLVNTMKDKNGNINKDNYEFVEKILISQFKKQSVYLDYIISFLEKIKDENGIIDKKEKKIIEELYSNRGVNFKDVIASIDFIREYPEEKREEVFDTIMNQRPYEKRLEHDTDFIIRAKFCYDKDGNPIDENIKIINEIDSKRYICYSSCEEKILHMCKTSEDFKEVFYKGIQFQENVVFQLADAIKEEMEEDGTIAPDKKEIMLKTLPYDQDLSNFPYIHHIYSQQENKEEYLQNLLAFFRLNSSNSLKVSFTMEEMMKLTAGIMPRNCNGIKEKLTLYREVQSAYNHSKERPDADRYSFLKNTIELIEKQINIANLSLPITTENKKLALDNIFKSKANELTDFEKTIKDSIPKLEKYKDGLPLKYTRTAFIRDIEKIIDENKDENVQDILKELGFNGTNPPECFYANSLKTNENDSDATKQIKALINKFLYENRVRTGNKDLDKQINRIIKAFPEFVNMIGRKQHQTHDYTLDIHTLLVLAQVINNPEYKDLNAIDKLTIKSVALFHDISKKENEIDKNHPDISAAAAKSILSKIYPNKENLERVYNLIRHHNFLEEYDNASTRNKEITARTLGFAFRRPNDYKLAKMLTKADLKSVNKDFYDKHKDKLSENYLLDITGRVNDFQNTGNAIFPTYIVNTTQLNKHKKKIKGREFTVIDTHNIGNKEDLGNYGFEKGTRKKDLRFLVHMTDNLENIKILDEANENSVLSESFISLNHQKTYRDRKYGFILKHRNYDIINTDACNQASGAKKDLDHIIRLLQRDERYLFHEKFLHLLDLNPHRIELKDYQKFYNEVLANITSLKQINPNKTYNIGKKEFTGQELIDVLKNCQDSLFSATNKHHNEIVGFAPEIQGVIAKELFLHKLPDEFLDFAHENNYPIILI